MLYWPHCHPQPKPLPPQSIPEPAPGRYFSLDPPWQLPPAPKQPESMYAPCPQVHQACRLEEEIWAKPNKEYQMIDCKDLCLVMITDRRRPGRDGRPICIIFLNVAKMTWPCRRASCPTDTGPARAANLIYLANTLTAGSHPLFCANNGGTKT